MNLGQNIYRLRIRQHLSQTELADALNVSRQSVSKWETGSAVPDLDKLVRLSQIFGVSLDELVQGPSTAESDPTPFSEAEKEVPAASGTPQTGGRQLAGILLLFFAGLVWLVLTLLGGPLTGIVAAVPFLLCGLICLLVRFHPGLWCGWAVFLIFHLFLYRAVGAGSLLLLYVNVHHTGQLLLWLLNLLAAIVLIVCTVRCFPKKAMANTRRNRLLLAMGWVVLLLLFLPLPFPWQRLSPAVLYCIFFVRSLLKLTLLPLLIIVSLRLYRGWKSN